ncbi:MAG: hypothetical protein AB7V14_12380 [Kiritimatiellia bacterium]
MNAISTNGTERRRGVALIVVLGFLSIMVMMAVAFLTQARIERLVAGASLEGMRTRQLAQTAIAAGMQDYLNALKKMDSQADTEHDVFLSGDESGPLGYYYSGLTIDDDRLALGKVEDWLLESHLEAALSGGGDAVRNAEWIWVRERPGQRSRILGRYAYACFDMSGQIDANLLGTGFGDSVPTAYEHGGDSTNRNNVRKMLFDAVKKDPDTGNARQSVLNKHQRIWKGFDTPAALLNLTDGDWNDGRNSGANRWLGADMDEEDMIDVSDLSCYSYSATHLGSEAGGNLKAPCNASGIEQVGGTDFDAILDGADRTDVLNALQDFESPASLYPKGVDYPSVKNVPMFNEIGVKVDLENPGGGANYEMVVRLKLEFWYPFASEDNERPDTFTMTLPTLGFGTAGDGPEDIWVRVAGGTNASTPTISFTPAGPITTVPADSVNVSAKFNNGKPYFANALTDDEIVYRVPLGSSGGPLPPGMYLFVRAVRIKGPLKLELAGQPWDATSSEPIGHLIQGSYPAGGGTPWYSIAVNDPRLNHEADAWMPEDPPSFGEVNHVAESARSSAKSGTGVEPGEYLYCRNGPMHSPAELGYLPTAKAWSTLDIFSDQGTWLMNRLVSDPAVYGMMKAYKVFFTNGTINPYTRNTNVLNAAFYGVSLAEVPNMLGTASGNDKQLTSSSELDELVEVMLAEEAKKGHAGWSTILNQGSLNSDWNKNNRIALLSHTWGLFDESDRLFVIAVVAQSIKEGEGLTGRGNWNDEEDMITGERRAVALCWMDGSSEGSADTLAQELNIIAFQYLND